MFVGLQEEEYICSPSPVDRCPWNFGNHDHTLFAPTAWSLFFFSSVNLSTDGGQWNLYFAQNLQISSIKENVDLPLT